MLLSLEVRKISQKLTRYYEKSLKLENWKKPNFRIFFLKVREVSLNTRID